MHSQYKRILVAVDGSDAAKKALEKAINIAKKNDITLIIGHVIDINVIPMSAAYSDSLEEQTRENAEALLTKYEEQAKEAGITIIEKVIDYGSARALIAKKIAPEHNADLIIIGATGLNMVERFLMGSVSEATARHATCDVLVVRN